MSAIDDLFRRLRTEGRRAFVPFVTAGDPDLGFSAELLPELGRAGCSLCEVGIPYSDPIADGPVIQASYTRALARHTTLADIWAVLQQVTPKLTMPVVTMVSYAIVYRHGLEKFVADAQAAGVAGAIVPDLLVEESAELAGVCRKRDFSLIQLVTPTTPRERAVRIAESSTGFVYYVSVTGITGERWQLPDDLLESVSWLRQRTSLPICIGFGISRPEHVRLLAPVADGLIVGSAIVRRLENAATAREEAKRQITALVGELMGAMPNSAP
jgi:tryptophan synthase alpha chain